MLEEPKQKERSSFVVKDGRMEEPQQRRTNG